MRILLQHTQTLHYLRTDNTWTRNHFDARDFTHSDTAIAFARNHGLRDVYVTVKFPGDYPEVVVPLPSHARTVSAALPASRHA